MSIPHAVVKNIYKNYGSQIPHAVVKKNKKMTVLKNIFHHLFLKSKIRLLPFFIDVKCCCKMRKYNLIFSYIIFFFLTPAFLKTILYIFLKIPSKKRGFIFFFTTISHKIRKIQQKEILKFCQIQNLCSLEKNIQKTLFF